MKTRKVSIRLMRMVRYTRGARRWQQPLHMNGPPPPNDLKLIDSYVRYGCLTALDFNTDDPNDSTLYLGPDVLAFPEIFVAATVLKREEVLRQYPERVAFVARMDNLGHTEALVSRSGDLIAITERRIPGDANGCPLPGYASTPTWPDDERVSALIEALRADTNLMREATFSEDAELRVWHREGPSMIIPLPKGSFTPVDPLTEDTLEYTVQVWRFAHVDGVAFRHVSSKDIGPYYVMPMVYTRQTLEKRFYDHAYDCIPKMREDHLSWAIYHPDMQKLLPVHDVTRIVDRHGRPLDMAERARQTEALPHPFD